MYVTKLFLLIFIFININHEAFCPNTSTDLMDHNSTLDGKAKLPAGNFKSGKSGIVEDNNAKGTSKNKIKLTKDVKNFEAYAILENDECTFTFNVFNYDGCSSLTPCNFNVNVSSITVEFRILNYPPKLLIEMGFNGGELIPVAKIQFSDSLTVTFNKNGSISVDKKLPNTISSSIGFLQTVPTKDGGETIHLKFDGSNLNEATLDLYFNTKVGKNDLAKASIDWKIIVPVVCLLVVGVAAVSLTCIFCSKCPVYQRIHLNEKHEITDKKNDNDDQKQGKMKKVVSSVKGVFKRRKLSKNDTTASKKKETQDYNGVDDKSRNPKGEMSDNSRFNQGTPSVNQNNCVNIADVCAPVNQNNNAPANIAPPSVSATIPFAPIDQNDVLARLQASTPPQNTNTSNKSKQRTDDTQKTTKNDNKNGGNRNTLINVPSLSMIQTENADDPEADVHDVISFKDCKIFPVKDPPQ